MVYLVRRGSIIPVCSCKKCKKIYVYCVDGITERRKPIEEFEEEFHILKATNKEDACVELESTKKEIEKKLLEEITAAVKSKSLSIINTENKMCEIQRTFYKEDDMDPNTPIVSIICLQGAIRIMHTSFVDQVYTDDIRKYFSGDYNELLEKLVNKLSKKHLNDPNALHYVGTYKNSGKCGYVSLKEFDYIDIQTNPDSSGYLSLYFKSRDNRLEWKVSTSIYKKERNVMEDCTFNVRSGEIRMTASFSELKNYGFDCNKIIKDFYSSLHEIEEFEKDENVLKFIYVKDDISNAYIYRRANANRRIRFEAIKLPRQFYQKAIDKYKKIFPIKLEFYEYGIYAEIDAFSEVFKIKDERLHLKQEPPDPWSSRSMLEGISDMKYIDDKLMAELLKMLKRQLGDDVYSSIALMGELGD